MCNRRRSFGLVILMCAIFGVAAASRQDAKASPGGGGEFSRLGSSPAVTAANPKLKRVRGIPIQDPPRAEKPTVVEDGFTSGATSGR